MKRGVLCRLCHYNAGWIAKQMLSMLSRKHHRWSFNKNLLDRVTSFIVPDSIAERRKQTFIRASSILWHKTLVNPRQLPREGLKNRRQFTAMHHWQEHWDLLLKHECPNILAKLENCWLHWLPWHIYPHDDHDERIVTQDPTNTGVELYNALDQIVTYLEVYPTHLLCTQKEEWRYATGNYRRAPWNTCCRRIEEQWALLSVIWA